MTRAHLILVSLLAVIPGLWLYQEAQDYLPAGALYEPRHEAQGVTDTVWEIWMQTEDTSKLETIYPK